MSSFSMQKKNFKFVNLIIKLILVGLLGYVLYQGCNRESANESLELFKSSLETSNAIYLIIALLLMPLNWILESEKWRSFLHPFADLPSLSSLKCVIAGVFMGMVTPARVGEYGGRIIYLPYDKKWEGIMATLASSLCQNMVNLVLGAVGALYFLSLYPFTESSMDVMVGVTIAVVIAVLAVVMFRQKILKFGPTKLPNGLLNKIKKQLNIIEHLQVKYWYNGLFLSALRFAIYTTQYVLLLYFFDLEIPVFIAVSGIWFIFLLQSFFPLPPLLGILARGEIALIIWSVYTDNILGILASTFMLWIINLIIPSIVGMYLVLSTDLVDSFRYKLIKNER